MGTQRAVWSPPPSLEESLERKWRRWADNRRPHAKGITDRGFTHHLKQEGKVSQELQTSLIRDCSPSGFLEQCLLVEQESFINDSSLAQGSEHPIKKIKRSVCIYWEPEATWSGLNGIARVACSPSSLPPLKGTLVLRIFQPALCSIEDLVDLEIYSRDKNFLPS